MPAARARTQSAYKNTPQHSSAVSARNDSPEHITCGLTTAHIPTNALLCVRYVGRHSRANMIGNDMRAFTLARRSSYVVASLRPVGPGAVVENLLGRMRWVDTSVVRQGEYVSDPYSTRSTRRGVGRRRNRRPSKLRVSAGRASLAIPGGRWPVFSR